MKKTTVCFAGHSMITENKDMIYEKLIANLRDIILENDKITFLCGTYGDFDNMCTRAVSELKTEYGGKKDIELYIYLPYHDRLKYIDGQFYNNITGTVIADIPEKCPKNLCILKTNEQIADSSDILVCYVTSNTGGAYKTLTYAKKKDLLIKDLSKL